MTTEELIREQIASTPVIIYMKGTPDAPQCGFSAKAVEALKAEGKPFGYINVLEDPTIRAELPKIANWPTFPQLWVKGELIGGCDIVLEMAESGELHELLESVVWE